MHADAGDAGYLYAARLFPDRAPEPCSGALEVLERGEGLLVLVLDANDPRALDWVRRRAGISPVGVNQILSPSGRPAAYPFGEALQLTLRGVNLNEGRDPDDMLVIRMWAESDRIVVLRAERVRALEDVEAGIAAQPGVADAAEWLRRFVAALLQRMRPYVEDLDDQLDELEDAVIDDEREVDRHELVNLRRQVVAVKRWLVPQRDALARLTEPDLPVVGGKQRLGFRELAARQRRYVEDLLSLRERAVVLSEEIAAQVAERMNERVYLFTVLAGVFLPLTFLTGLLGVNVAGIPGAEHPDAFLWFCGLCAAIAVGAWLLLRRRSWV